MTDTSPHQNDMEVSYKSTPTYHFTTMITHIQGIEDPHSDCREMQRAKFSLLSIIVVFKHDWTINTDWYF